MAMVVHAAMLVTFKLCLPLLLAALVAGLLVAILQAVTQVSDSSLSFLPKLVATGASIWVSGPFLVRTLADFTHGVMDRLIAIGGR